MRGRRREALGWDPWIYFPLPLCGPTAPGKGMNGGRKAVAKSGSVSPVTLLPPYLVLRGTVPGVDQVRQGICTTLSCRGGKTPNPSLYHRRGESRG